MKIRTSWRLGWLVPLGLAACAAHAPGPGTSKQTASPGRVSPQMRSGSSALHAYQVNDWTAPDDRTLIVNAADRSVYQARFKGSCTGLRLVDTIAFVMPGSPQLDTYTGIVLPDGRRCAFRSLTRLAVPSSEDPSEKPTS